MRGLDSGTSVGRSKKTKMLWCQPLRFLSEKNRPTIALVSFPGSGNTWLRYLLQQATGENFVLIFYLCIKLPAIASYHRRMLHAAHFPTQIVNLSQTFQVSIPVLSTKIMAY